MTLSRPHALFSLQIHTILRVGTLPLLETHNTHYRSERAQHPLSESGSCAFSGEEESRVYP